MSDAADDQVHHRAIHDDVRRYYRDAALTGATPSGDDDRWGPHRCEPDTLDPETSDAGVAAAAELSMGCGNPYAIARLEPGDTVLDLGSGGGLDVILSAQRVAPIGVAYGVDFLPEMLDLARANAREAGVSNAEFLEGMIEDVPLPDGSIDVVISNCVVNLAPDKAAVFSEIVRLLRPGGRVAISDVVADDGFTRSDDGPTWAEDRAGALRYSDYLRLLQRVGLEDPSIEITHETGPGLHGATIRAHKQTTS